MGGVALRLRLCSGMLAQPAESSHTGFPFSGLRFCGLPVAQSATSIGRCRHLYWEVSLIGHARTHPLSPIVGLKRFSVYNSWDCPRPLPVEYSVSEGFRGVCNLMPPWLAPLLPEGFQPSALASLLAGDSQFNSQTMHECDNVVVSKRIRKGFSFSYALSPSSA